MQNKIISLSLLVAASTLFNQDALAYPLTQGNVCKNSDMIKINIKTPTNPVFGSVYCLPKVKVNEIEASVKDALKKAGVTFKNVTITTAGGDPNYMKYATTATEPLRVIIIK